MTSLLSHATIEQRIVSPDERSIKFRWMTHDRRSCECVALFPRPTRCTACISTQIGCAVGCVFCATGRMGLTRNLTAQEILAQLDLIKAEANNRLIPLRNVVYMGMGEPFHNYEALLEATEQILDPKRFGIGPRHLTVSTAGVPSKMLDFAAKFPRVRQALSLHSAILEKRRSLMPHALGSLDVLRTTIQQLAELLDKSPVWLEYVLIRDYNDSQEDLDALVYFCRDLAVEVNVIPYNAGLQANSDAAKLPIHSESSLNRDGTSLSISALNKRTARAIGLSRPSDAQQDWFIRELRQAGIFTTLRKSLGESIAAACGQLIIQSKDA
jgi:23S rRNA (adenine2503-C2)-methyltransferase